RRLLMHLRDLTSFGLSHRRSLPLAEEVTATAALGPVLDDLVHRPRRQQLPPVALVVGLGAAPLARGVLAARRGTGRIGARWTRGVARALLQLPLEFLHTCLKLLDAAVHPQQHLDDDLSSGVVDRLRFDALHAEGVDAEGLCPLTD